MYISGVSEFGAAVDCRHFSVIVRYSLLLIMFAVGGVEVLSIFIS